MQTAHELKVVREVLGGLERKRVSLGRLEMFGRSSVGCMQLKGGWGRLAQIPGKSIIMGKLVTFPAKLRIDFACGKLAKEV